MHLLALDTSMGNCSAAVAVGGRDGQGAEILSQCNEAMARGHAEALMPMVEKVMAEARLGFDELDRIAATTGPGSFTGVRIAIAAARGLALATHADLWGTDSLTVMAARAVAERINDGAPFAIAVDARRGALSCATFASDGTLKAGPALLEPQDALTSMPEEIGLVLGSGAALLQEASGGALKTAAPDLQPDAASLARLGLMAEESVAQLKPFYIRPPDAKPQTGKAVERR